MKTADEVMGLLHQILSMWNPPSKGGSPTECSQTAAVIAYAFVLDDDFPMYLLTDTQKQVVKEGLAVFNEFIQQADEIGPRPDRLPCPSCRRTQATGGLPAAPNFRADRRQGIARCRKCRFLCCVDLVYEG